MSCMKGKIFFDSNILIYAYTHGEPAKCEKSKDLLRRAFEGEIEATISNQVIGELSRALITKFDVSVSEIESIIDDLNRYIGLNKVSYGPETIKTAVRYSDAYGVPFWDSVIAATMKENGIIEIITENDRDFSDIPEIQVTNPFKH